MSQIPPPPPGQSGQPGQPGMGAVGSNKKLYTILAYALGWIGGLIFLFVGKDDPDVKWNAAQSLVVFGGLQIIGIVLTFIPFLGLIVWLISIITWVYFLIQTLQGNGERVAAPVVGPAIAPLVAQLANAVN
jgi:uncharacterized membrane protein